MHAGSNPNDGSTLDADALAAVIRRIERRGYRFTSLSHAYAAAYPRWRRVSAASGPVARSGGCERQARGLTAVSVPSAAHRGPPTRAQVAGGAPMLEPRRSLTPLTLVSAAVAAAELPAVAGREGP